MKLIKAIKLHRKLRKIQEQLFEDCVFHSQLVFFTSKIDGKYPAYPELNYYTSINKAVEKVSSKLPWLYFAISDIFGLYKSFKPVKNK